MLSHLTVIKGSKVKTLACRPRGRVKVKRRVSSLSRLSIRYRGVLDARCSRGLSRLCQLKKADNNTEPGVVARVSKRG